MTEREKSIIDDMPRELMTALLDNPYESMVVVDADGIIRYISHSNAEMYDITPEEAVGRPLTEVSPESEIGRVLQTGKAEIGRSMLLKNQKRIVARIPLLADGKVVGAMGKVLFMSLEKFKELYGRIDALEQQLDYYKTEFNQVYGSRYTFNNIIGQSAALQNAKAQALTAARSDSPVIITGESGTGKELFAHSIHQASRRNDQNFIRVNCAAIPADLIEAELFGYEAGAFTGAGRHGKPGKFELAHRGTIFLDEIGEMPPLMQVKLLRVLQEKEVERLGGGKPRRIDFRIISATNRNPSAMVGKGGFRLDLYYRLNVFAIQLPALREIPDDIPLIFDHTLNEFARNRRGDIPVVSKAARNALSQYHWPGNVRELRNVAERTMIIGSQKEIHLEDLPILLRTSPADALRIRNSNSSLKEILEETERNAIVAALDNSNQNRIKASQLLGIHRTGLYQKMRKYGLL